MKPLTRKVFPKVFVLTAGVFSCGVPASTIFGDIPGLENIEWLELTATEDMSRYAVESQLSAEGMFAGWRFATRREVETLYDGLWGGTTEYRSADNYSGARRFFDAFGIGNFFADQGNGGYSTYLDDYGYTFWNAFFGNVGECGTDPTESCHAYVKVYEPLYGGPRIGVFSDNFGLSTGVDDENVQATYSSSYAGLNWGSHLVKVSVIPLPSAVWLLATGLVSLVGIAGRKQRA